MTSEALRSPDQLKRGARVGFPLAAIRSERKNGQNTIREVKRVNCISSLAYATRLAASATFDKDLRSLCSATVTIRPAVSSLRLNSIAGAKTVTLSLKLPKQVACLGDCDRPIIFSVRAVLSHGGDIFPSMIELSPQAVRRFASSNSSDGLTQEYSMTGGRLLDVAKSQFIESFGNRDRDHFAFTKGLVTWLLMAFTQRSETKKLISIVWTTSANVDSEQLLDAIPESYRPNAEILNGPEWCGFGDVEELRGNSDSQLCWYRFVVMSPAP